MNDYSKLADEICKVGNLEPFRDAIKYIFEIIKEKPCKISFHYNKNEPSSCAFLNGNAHIRVGIKNRPRPLIILWDLLHEYGHFVSGERKENDTDISREMVAWQHATETFIKLPWLLWYADDFQNYMAQCIDSYIFKAWVDHQKTKRYNIEAFLKLHMPSLLELLEQQKIAFTSFNVKLQDHLVSVAEEIAKKRVTVSRDVNFQSILVGKLEGNASADTMFSFFESVFKSLNQKLSTNEKKLLHPIISQLLSNVNRDYLNYIGELAVLNYNISTYKYKLLDIGAPISSNSNKDADLLFKVDDNGKELLIDVYNLRLEDKVFDTSDDLKKHILRKFTEKSQQKVINPDREIQIQPVIWYKDIEQLKFVSDLYNKDDCNVPNVLEPLAWLCFHMPNEPFTHRFESIKNILKD